MQLIKLGVFMTALTAVHGLLPVVFQQNIPGSKPIKGDSPMAQCDLMETQILSITHIDLDPNPPQRNAELTIQGSGIVAKNISEGAYINVEVRLGYIKLLTQSFDLCELLDENDVEGLSCPIDAGEYDLVKKVEIPAEVPPGKYTVLARAYTVEDELITCITGDVIFPASF